MSFTLHTRSVFKYLLAGLLVSLLVLNSEALPARASRRSLSLVESGSDDLELRAPVVAKTPAARGPKKAPVTKKPAPKKAPAGGRPKKGPAKKAPAKGGKKTTGVKACPIKRPAKKTKRSLYPRAPTAHPSGKSSTTLFHGTRAKASADSAKTVDLSKTHPEGDYHSRGGSCDGGFYLTDSLFAAAQFVCYQDGQPPVDTVYVNQYKWTPPAGLKHKAYSAAGSAIDKQAAKDCKAHDLLEGPMDGMFDKNLHKDFWQYTIVNQKTAAGLAFEKQYTIPCVLVEKGKNIDSSLYQKGQASNPEFQSFANELEGSC